MPDERDGVRRCTWSGEEREKPTRIAMDFGKVRPEALFEIIGTGQVHILSDAGDEMVDGLKCKHKDTPAAKRSFRSRTVKLP